LLAGAALVGTAPAAFGSVGTKPDVTWQTNGRVSAIVVAGDGTTYLGGQFTAVRPAGVCNGCAGTVTRNHLAAFDSNGNLITKWDPNPNGNVSALAISPVDGTVIAGGDFTTVNGGVARSRLAGFAPAGGAATVRSWTANASATVTALSVSGSTLYAGGKFTSIAGGTRTRLAAFTLGSGTLSLNGTWKPKASATVNALAVAADGSGRVFAGGAFATVNGATASHFAALNGSTGALTGWASAPPGPVLKIAVTSTRVFVGEGGSGGQVGGYDQSTGAFKWRVQTDGDVQAIALTGSELYVGGHFNNVCGGDGGGSGAPFVCNTSIARKHLCSVNTTTADPLGVNAASALTAWNPKANSNLGVFAMTADGARLDVGGDFTTIGGTSQQGFARFH
jgi:hypothetical protein